MPSFFTTLLILTTILLVLPGAFAFGAGDIPDFAYLQDKAFRHGDIENILANLAKSAGRSFGGGGGLLGNVVGALASAAAGGAGPKFSKMDIKRVYFGNWLRDYSQAMDIAGLSKLSADNLLVVVSVLAFMTFGYATEEFQVTADRLGVYLPVEHIDNPKGYAEKEGDARRFHPKLRPPVNNRELEIDPNNGMKKYIATENQGWDTSSAHIRRSLQGSIQKAREARGQENASLWEAYRLLGSALHTLEDLLAHSNWCELALRKMGHSNVFCYVGDNVRVNTPNGPAPPLVTGTFGSADFMHSMLGESVDHLSESSLNDLSKKMDEAKKKDSKQSPIQTLRMILSQLPSSQGQGDKVQQAEQMKAASLQLPKRVGNVDIKEVQKRLWELLVWRDGVMRDVSRTIENIPGLSDLVEQLTEALNVYIYTVLEPYLTPILTEATGALREGSKAVIDSDDQYQVFNDPNCSDPSHSMLAKDHFDNILNEPAGKVAQVVVEHTVNVVVQAWSSQEDPGAVVNKILEAFHHPYYARRDSQVQAAMFQRLQEWFNGLGANARTTLEVLTKESVKDGRNKRLGEDGKARVGSGHSHGESTTYPGQGRTQYGSGGQQGGGYGGSAAGYGVPAATTTYGGRKQTGYGTGYGQTTRDDEGDSYNSKSHQYESGGRQDSKGYGGSTSGYGGRNQGGYGGATGYGQATRDDEEDSYNSKSHQYEGGGRSGSKGNYGGSAGGHGNQGGYGGSTNYGQGTRNDEEDSYNSKSHQYESGGGSGYKGGYGGSTGGYGGSGGGYGGNTTGYGGATGGYGGGGDYGGSTGGYGGTTTGYGGYRQTTGNDEDDSYNSKSHQYESGGRSGQGQYGSSGGYRDNTETQYGSRSSNQYGGGQRGRQDEDEYRPRQTETYGGSGGSRGGDSSNYAYGASNQYSSTGGYGSRRDTDEHRRRSGEDDSYKSKRGQYDSGGYGGRRGKDDDDSDDGKKKKSEGRYRKDDDEDSDDAKKGKKKKGDRRRDSDETYGAERLNIRDDQGGRYGGYSKHGGYRRNDDD